REVLVALQYLCEIAGGAPADVGIGAINVLQELVRRPRPAGEPRKAEQDGNGPADDQTRHQKQLNDMTPRRWSHWRQTLREVRGRRGRGRFLIHRGILGGPHLLGERRTVSPIPTALR